MGKALLYRREQNQGSFVLAESYCFGFVVSFDFLPSL